jgi:hypothetical protein
MCIGFEMINRGARTSAQWHWHETDGPDVPPTVGLASRVSVVPDGRARHATGASHEKIGRRPRAVFDKSQKPNLKL